MNVELEALAGSNFENPVLRLAHKDLERASEDSAYRTVCPTCKEGVLLVGRDRETFRLERDDHCILCGQRVHYVGELGFFDEEIPPEE